MSRRKLQSAGFTLVELIVTISVLSVLTVTFYTLFGTSINRYLALQKEGLVFGDLAAQSQRVATVLRGLTDITAATDDGITFYAYFAPSDAYVSLVRYYKSADKTILYADVTPYDANPPNGTLQTSKKQTYTVINNLYTAYSLKTFVYLDAGNTALTVPIADLHTIKAIQVNLAIPNKSPSVTGVDAISLKVSLRNRKTNL